MFKIGDKVYYFHTDKILCGCHYTKHKGTIIGSSRMMYKIKDDERNINTTAYKNCVEKMEEE